MFISPVAGSLARSWNRLWFRTHDPLPAGVFRICLGCLLTAMYLALYPNWERYFGASGVLSLGDPVLPRLEDSWWSLFHWFPDVPFRILWVIGLVAALGFTAGWRTRFWTLVLFALETSMINRNRFAI